MQAIESVKRVQSGIRGLGDGKTESNLCEVGSDGRDGLQKHTTEPSGL